jgi:uncharacterized surface protein with fasciclin (FAS1) repeats
MVRIAASLNQRITKWLIVGHVLLSVQAVGQVTGTTTPVKPAQKEEKDVFDKMVLDPSLKTFVGLIVKADMVEMFKAEGPITVFAPINSAFERLPSGFLETLRKDRALLRRTLSFHMIHRKLLTKDMTDGIIKSSTGEVTTVKIRPGMMPTVNGVRITIADIETSNGALNTTNAIMVLPSKPLKGST